MGHYTKEKQAPHVALGGIITFLFLFKKFPMSMWSDTYELSCYPIENQISPEDKWIFGFFLILLSCV
jgi:hypothetical protein